VNSVLLSSCLLRVHGALGGVLSAPSDRWNGSAHAVIGYLESRISSASGPSASSGKQIYSTVVARRIALERFTNTICRCLCPHLEATC
jgi:hypothetical protein